MQLPPKKALVNTGAWMLAAGVIALVVNRRARRGGVLIAIGAGLLALAHGFED